MPCGASSPAVWNHPRKTRKSTDFTIKGDLLDHVRKFRAELVTAALTLLRAHTQAGRPDGGLTPLGSFEQWSFVVRAAVYWTVGLDPCETRKDLKEYDTESIARAALIEGWAELPYAERGLSIADALRHLVNPDHAERFGTLRSVLMQWCRNGDLPARRRSANVSPPSVAGSSMENALIPFCRKADSIGGLSRKTKPRSPLRGTRIHRLSRKVKPREFR